MHSWQLSHSSHLPSPTPVVTRAGGGGEAPVGGCAAARGARRGDDSSASLHGRRDPLTRQQTGFLRPAAAPHLCAVCCSRGCQAGRAARASSAPEPLPSAPASSNASTQRPRTPIRPHAPSGGEPCDSDSRMFDNKQKSRRRALPTALPTSLARIRASDPLTPPTHVLYSSSFSAGAASSASNVSLVASLPLPAAAAASAAR